MLMHDSELTSRRQLVDWINALLDLQMTKVEQCGTGAALCQIFDSIGLENPPNMAKVKFNANTEYAYRVNFAVLQEVFSKNKIEKPIQVESLIKCKPQDNIEFLQWVYKFWYEHAPSHDTSDYNGLARRKGTGMAPAAGSSLGTRAAANTTARRGTTPTTGGRVGSAAARAPGGGAASAALQQENATLKETVVGLERERDFYFGKLRDIELLVQQAVEEDPEIEKDEDGLIKHIQNILYSTEDGFEIPAEGAEPVDDQETF